MNPKPIPGTLGKWLAWDASLLQGTMNTHVPTIIHRVLNPPTGMLLGGRNPEETNMDIGEYTNSTHTVN